MKSLILIAAATALGVTQPGTPSVAGTWIAELDGKTYVRLELVADGAAVAGRISLGNVEFDKRGGVGNAHDAPRDFKPISDVQRRGAVLAFAVAGSDDPDRFEFRLVEAGRAELKLLLSAEQREELQELGIPDPRPFTLTRR